MADPIPAPFEQSGLPDTKDIRKAFELVKDNPRAIGTSRILADVYPRPEAIVANMIAFIEPRMELKDIESTFTDKPKDSYVPSDYIAHAVRDIRKIIDEDLRPVPNGYSDEIRIIFMAAAIYDLEDVVAKWKDKPLATPLIQTYRQGEKTVMLQLTLEQLLRKARREVEDKILPTIELDLYEPRFEKLTTRFKESFRALELKIAAPEKQPAPSQKAKPRQTPKF